MWTWRKMHGAMYFYVCLQENLHVYTKHCVIFTRLSDSILQEAAKECEGSSPHKRSLLKFVLREAYETCSTIFVFDRISTSRPLIQRIYRGLYIGTGAGLRNSLMQTYLTTSQRFNSVILWLSDFYNQTELTLSSTNLQTSVLSLSRHLR